MGKTSGDLGCTRLPSLLSWTGIFSRRAKTARPATRSSISAQFLAAMFYVLEPEEQEEAGLGGCWWHVGDVGKLLSKAERLGRTPA